MNQPREIRNFPLVGLAGALILGAALLFPGLGDFGMWEPQETSRSEIAQALHSGRPLPEDTPVGFHLGERLAAWGVGIGGVTELAQRAPQGVVALIGLCLCYLLLWPVAGARRASFAALVLVSSPVFLFHGRQLTGAAPLLACEIAATGGLALAALAPTFRVAVAGLVIGALGLVFGILCAGLLVGVVAPCATVFVALALAGDLRPSWTSPPGEPGRRLAVGLVSGVVALFALGGFITYLLLSQGDNPLVTGGLSARHLPRPSFDFVLQQLAHGWFPWSAVAPLVLLRCVAPQQSDRERRLTALVVAGVAVGVTTQGFFIALHGTAPTLLALPLALAVALVLDDLDAGRLPTRLPTAIALGLIAIMIRDFAQEPATLLNGYGVSGIKVPEEFNPARQVAYFSVPLLALLVLVGLIGPLGDRESRWNRSKTPLLLTGATACLGGYLSYLLVPGLAVHLSSRHALEAFDRFRTGNEPLGIYGPGPAPTPKGRGAETKRLGNMSELSTWLGREDRVFALFPPAKLAEVNRAFRRRFERHVFVLDDQSDRFLLATSAPQPVEKNLNPIAPYVAGQPFPFPQKNATQVNFDDAITLLGWELRGGTEEGVFEKGDELTLTTIWRCDKSVGRDYKMFVHIDGPGGRIHADHEPVDGIFPTGMWSAGEHIKDVYTRQIPYYQKGGSYLLRLGLYKGSKRMKIVAGTPGKNNAVKLTSIQIR